MAQRIRRPYPKPPGATTRGGWGSGHQKLAAQALAQWQPGDLCTRCGLPMWERWRTTSTGKLVSAIHLDHDDLDRTQYRGLAHASCNIAASNRSPRRHRGHADPSTWWPPLRTSRQW